MEHRRLKKKFQDMQKPTKLEEYSASHPTAKQYFYRLDRLYREEGTGAYDGDVKDGKYKEYNNKRFALEKVLMKHWGNSEMMEKEFQSLVKPEIEEEAKRTLKQFMRDWLFTFSPAAATLRRKPVVDELIQKNEPKDENQETPKAEPPALTEPDDEDEFLQTVQTIPDDAQARAYYNQWEHKFR
ncbi:hypothetical protein [Anaerobaca lacustris]|uniref:Uncharacterized protein n=1 Tax=Anaerobaca lacustris TaxID=3044600 RepID=A0AAW6TSA7_9BACT|nr:hypothetical protein [Sedimentisphaerales bacterium M17dextr]